MDEVDLGVDLDEGGAYRVRCEPETGEPFDFSDKYIGRDGNTLIFRFHRINLGVMRRVRIEGASA
jgi:hypothetical protein